MLDKKEQKLPVAVKDLIIVAIGVLVVIGAMRVAFDTFNPFYVVSSGSMVPTLLVNDVLVVRDGGSFGSLKVGDIIVFNRPDGGDRVIVHRIAEIYPDPNTGERTLRTKGDANPASIPGTDYPIHKSDYIGKVIFVLPGVGNVTKVLSPPTNYIIIAVILGLLFLTRRSKSKESQAGASTPDGRGGSGPASGGEPGTGTDASPTDSSGPGT
ncbi:MAG: signal peptidase I [Nitrososphaera sp.]